MGLGKVGINPPSRWGPRATASKGRPDFSVRYGKAIGPQLLMHKILATIVSIGLGSMTYGQDSKLASPPDIFNRTDDTKFAPITSELGKYQHKLYLQIGTRWNQKIQKTMSQIGTNRVVVKFRVNPDGKNDNISIAEGKPESELATISKEAILESSGSCGEFSEALKKEKPNGFDWQLPFRIY